MPRVPRDLGAFPSPCSEGARAELHSCLKLSPVPRSDPALPPPLAAQGRKGSEGGFALVFFTGDDWVNPLCEQCGSSVPHHVTPSKGGRHCTTKTSWPCATGWGPAGTGQRKSAGWEGRPGPGSALLGPTTSGDAEARPLPATRGDSAPARAGEGCR